MITAFSFGNGHFFKPSSGYTLLDLYINVAIAPINDFSSRKISKPIPKSATQQCR